MKRASLILTALLLLLASTGLAQTAPSTPAPAATPSATGLPPGHPTVATPSASALPPGHPPTGKPAPGSLPPGHPPAPKAPGHPPPANGQGRATIQPDRVLVDQSLPAGTVLVAIVNPQGAPIAKSPISLTTLENTVEKGESSSSRAVTANGRGRYRFEGLKTGRGISYRVTSSKGSANFSSSPFGLKDKHGVRVLLHVYPPTSDLANTLFVMEAFVVLDVKQDTVGVNHMLRTLNFGRKAYTPKNVTLKLPPEARAFSAQENPQGVGMVETGDGSIELVGTYPPGQAEITYRYSLPLSGSSDLALELPLPPRVVQATVMVGAGPGMTMNIAGFPAPKPARRRDGQRVLKTSRQPDMSSGVRGVLKKTSPEVLAVRISGIPTPGPGRWVALALALLAAAGGGLGLQRHRRDASDPNTTLNAERRDDLT
ncbi:MAG: hypothetical protein VB934_03750, partial [Polyangiaceae bacterium]